MNSVVVPKGQQIFFRTAKTAAKWAQAFDGELKGRNTVVFSRDVFLEEKKTFTKSDLEEASVSTVPSVKSANSSVPMFSLDANAFDSNGRHDAKPPGRTLGDL